jgi:hypothetical protein
VALPLRLWEGSVYWRRKLVQHWKLRLLTPGATSEAEDGKEGTSRLEASRPLGVENFAIWSGMKQRCYNTSCENYKYYGAREITVCDEWRNDFWAFHDWAMATGYHYSLQVDRKDNYAGYSPGNCRWVTPRQNCNNKRIHQDQRKGS